MRVAITESNTSREASTGAVDLIEVSFHGTVDSVKAPRGWTLQRAEYSGTASTVITWRAQRPSSVVKQGRSQSGFVVTTSGPAAGLACSQRYSTTGGAGAVKGCLSSLVARPFSTLDVPVRPAHEAEG